MEHAEAVDGKVAARGSELLGAQDHATVRAAVGKDLGDEGGFLPVGESLGGLASGLIALSSSSSRRAVRSEDMLRSRLVAPSRAPEQPRVRPPLGGWRQAPRDHCDRRARDRLVVPFVEGAHENERRGRLRRRGARPVRVLVGGVRFVGSTLDEQLPQPHRCRGRRRARARLRRGGREPYETSALAAACEREPQLARAA